MKKFMPLLFAVLFTTGVLAQDFTINPEVLEYQFSSEAEEVQIGYTITNNKDVAVDWFWDLERSEDFLDEWSIQVCDQVLCWNYGTEQFPTGSGLGNNQLDAGQSTVPDLHYVKVKNNNVSGSGTLRFCVFSDEDFSEVLVCTALSTSTSDLDTKDISIFPNPTTDYFEISADNSIATVEIYNIVGKKVVSFKHSEGNPYDVSTLRNGLYVVRVLNRRGELVKSMRLSKR